MVAKRELRTTAYLVALASACAHSPTEAVAPVEGHAPSPTEPEARQELEEAIAHYQATGEIGYVARYVDAHPDEDLGIWKEVVALRSYDALTEDPWSPGRAADVLLRYPDTYGATMLRMRLEREALAALSSPSSLHALVAVLEGKDTVILQGDAQIGVDPARLRRDDRARLEALLERRLLDHGCSEQMGYCNWWVEHYPDAPSTKQVRELMASAWHHRTYPGWKGRRHHRCAYRCGTTCREAAQPLEDSCYDSCYAKCQ